MAEMTVFKYDLPLDDDYAMFLPIDAQILMVDVQHDMPRLWALVNTRNIDLKLMEEWDFHVAGTGHPIDSRWAESHIGSFMMYNGQLVLHIFAKSTGQRWTARSEQYGAVIRRAA